MRTFYNNVFIFWVAFLQIVILAIPGFGNSISSNDTILYFVFSDSMAVYKLPDASLKPITYVSWRDTLKSNNYYVVHYTDALTHIEKLDPMDYRVENGLWEWANVKIIGNDSVWVENTWDNISLRDFIKYSPSKTIHSYHRCSVGDGFWNVVTTVILDSSENRISPILGHKDEYAYWISANDIMLFSQHNYYPQKFGNKDYYLANDIIFIYDATIHDTNFLSYGYGPVYSEKSDRIIFLKENQINETEKEILLCSIGLEGNFLKVIKRLNISDFGLIESNCMGYDGVSTSEIQILSTETSEQYKFELFYIYDCDNYNEDEERISKVIVIDSNGELVD